MSVFGLPITNPALQTVVGQQTELRTREREKAGSDSARRYKDAVDLKVAGAESADGLRPISDEEPEEGRERRRQKAQESRDDARSDRLDSPHDSEHPPHIDVRA